MISLLLGLGNVGRKYFGTRHNVGFDVADRVADLLKAEARPPTDEYRWSVATKGESELVIAWPKLYMNRSGIAATRLLERCQLTPDRMLVIVDDFNLPLGKLRFRQRGSDGGHNGLLSLIESLGTDDFPRLRLGIGTEPEAAPPDKMNAVEFVLGQFIPQERTRVDRMVATAAAAVLFAIAHPLEEVMAKYNNNPALPDIP